MIYVMSDGGTKLFAAIGVTYTAGSTLTCTNGTKTLTAKNTSGQWVFAIPEAGTWTVTAGNKSKSVSITKEGQFEEVNLASLVLFDGATGINTTVTGGFIYNGSTVSATNGQLVFEKEKNDYCALLSKNAFDVSNYNTLVVSVEILKVPDGTDVEYRRSVGLVPESIESADLTKFGDDSEFAAKQQIAAGDYTGSNVIRIDISSLTGVYKFASTWYSLLGVNVYFNEIRLE